MSSVHCMTQAACMEKAIVCRLLGYACYFSKREMQGTCSSEIKNVETYAVKGSASLKGNG